MKGRLHYRGYVIEYQPKPGPRGPDYDWRHAQADGEDLRQGHAGSVQDAMNAIDDDISERAFRAGWPGDRACRCCGAWPCRLATWEDD